MLRVVLAALLAANLLFFGFTRGWFDGVMGLNSIGDREPERLARQVRPESVRLLVPGALASASGTGGVGTAPAVACFEAGPFNAEEAPAVESALRAALPAGSWADERTERTGAGAAAGAGHVYRIAAADAALATRLPGLRLDPSGRTFALCPRAERPR